MHAYTVSAQQLAGLATIQAPGHMAWLRPARGQQHHPPMAMAMGMEMEASQVALLRFPVCPLPQVAGAGPARGQNKIHGHGGEKHGTLSVASLSGIS